ncbi:substrate binding domain-containing protein [Cupriavidus basilensis]
MQAIDDAEAALRAGKKTVRGKLRISASADFGRNLLNQWLEAFSAAHPELKIAPDPGSDSLSNLVQDDVDLAIRFGRPQDGSWSPATLAPNWRVLCASPDYLARHGEPRQPEELAHHDFIVLVTAAGPLNDFHFAKGRPARDPPCQWNAPGKPADGALARSWALAGRGIARRTIWDAAEDIRAGRLKVLLPDYRVAEGRRARRLPRHPLHGTRACGGCWTS